jgi:hypothetical protein
MKLCLPIFNFVFAENTIAADTEAAAFIPEVWAQTALGRLHSKCPMIGCVSRNYEDELASYGDTVYVPKRGTLVTNDKLPNTSVTLQNPSGSVVPCVLNNHKEVSFLVEDVAEAQSNSDIMEGYMGDGADAVAEDIEAMLTAHYADVDAANVITWDNSDSDAIKDTIKLARTKIVVEGKCPADEPRYLIIRDFGELLDCTHFTSRDYLDQSNIETGTVGTILGFNTKESGGCVYTVSPTQTHRLAFAHGAIALVTRRLPDPPNGTGAKGTTVTRDGVGLRVLYGYNMNYLGLQCTIDMLFGSCILRSEWLCEITE